MLFRDESFRKPHTNIQHTTSPKTPTPHNIQHFPTFLLYQHFCWLKKPNMLGQHTTFLSIFYITFYLTCLVWKKLFSTKKKKYTVEKFCSHTFFVHTDTLFWKNLRRHQKKQTRFLAGEVGCSIISTIRTIIITFKIRCFIIL